MFNVYIHIYAATVSDETFRIQLFHIRNAWEIYPGQTAIPNGSPRAPRSEHLVLSSSRSRKTVAIGHWCLMRCSPKRFPWARRSLPDQHVCVSDSC